MICVTDMDGFKVVSKTNMEVGAQCILLPHCTFMHSLPTAGPALHLQALSFACKNLHLPGSWRSYPCIHRICILDAQEYRRRYHLEPLVKEIKREDQLVEQQGRARATVRLTTLSRV